MTQEYETWKKHIDRRTLFIFDFDDTLVKTDSNIILKRDNHTVKLSSDEYLEYTPKPQDELDLSEFDTLINPRIIHDIFQIFKKEVKSDDSDVVILTARNDDIANDIYDFLKKHNVKPSELDDVVGVGDSGYASAIAKAMWIEEKISNNNYREVIFFDDSLDNREQVRFLEDKINDDLNNKVTFKIINPDRI